MTNDSRSPGPEPAPRPSYDSVVKAFPVGALTEVLDGVHALRMPMPFRLDHINLYVLELRDEWVLVDCGLDTDDTRAVWDDVLPRLLARKPIRYTIVTHCHPDHIGLAHWLEAKIGCTILMSREEHAAACRYLHEHDAFADRLRAQFVSFGVPVDVIDHVLTGRDYRRWVRRLPSRVDVIDADFMRRVAPEWHMLIGRGHSPAHVCLWNPPQRVMIAGDLVLPSITPNISLLPDSLVDPLGDYLASLHDFLELPCELLLPAHGAALTRTHERIAELQRHHATELDTLIRFCVLPRTVHECAAALFPRELPAQQLAFALGETAAHLVYLARREQLRCDESGPAWRFTRI